MISKTVLQSVVEDLYIKALSIMPKDYTTSLEKSFVEEKNPLAKLSLGVAIRGNEFAENCMMPICVSAGPVGIWFVKAGSKAIPEIEGGIPTLEKTIHEVQREITKPERGNIRPTLRQVLEVDKNPLDYMNEGLRMPPINYKFDNSDYIELTVAMKGVDPEAWTSALRYMHIYEGVKGIKKFFIEDIIRGYGLNYGLGCPPGVVGIGVGGTMEVSVRMATEAAMIRPIGDRYPEPDIAKLELELLGAANDLGIGPLAFGGKSLLLDVHIEKALHHFSNFPVALVHNCAAARRKTAIIYSDGKNEEKENNEYYTIRS